MKSKYNNKLSSRSLNSIKLEIIAVIKSLLKKIMLIGSLVNKYPTYARAVGSDSIERLQSTLIIATHVLEKGLSHEKVRLEFGKKNIQTMAMLLLRWNF